MYKKYLWDPSVRVPRCTVLKRKRRAALLLEQQKAWEEENANQNGEQESHLPNPTHLSSPSSVSASSGDENTHETLGASVEVSKRRRKQAKRRPRSAANMGQLANEELLSISTSSGSESDSRNNERQQTPQDYSSTESDEDEQVEQEEITEEIEITRETICPCSKLTSDDVVIMVLSLGIRHHMSWTAQVDVLNLVNKIYDCDKVPSSKYLYKSKIGHNLPGAEYHVYCSNKKCNKYLGNKNNLDEVVTCSCSHVSVVSESQSFFVSLNLEEQFRNLFLDESVVKSLFSHRFNREKQNPDNFEDVYDGALYQKLFLNNGILSNPHNFSYSFNTDGMPVGKTSSRTLWPIYLTINELPPHEREKHVLLAGLYCGYKDPNQTMFLTPFVEQANKLSSTGFSWTFNGSKVDSLVIPMCAVVDSVARHQMLNMTSFHGTHGCTFCYHKTVHTRKGQKYAVCNDAVLMRTRESTISDCKEAYLLRHAPPTKRVYKGVKGDSPLLYMNYFNLISGFVPDYMHAILQGVIRTHMDLLFASTRKKFWIGMTDQIAMDVVVNALDERLLNFAPPKIVTRTTRTLHDRANWKASEWRGWLVLFCIPCVKGILRKKHVSHLALLCTATSILLSRSISENDVSIVRRLLLRYVFLFQKYFGVENMNYSIHLLLHIPDQVLNWGPLFCHNCFLYEGQNRLMLKMLHSPNQIVKQLLCKFLTYGSLPSLVYKFDVTKQAREFCENILSRTLKKIKIFGNVRVVGAVKAGNLTEEEEQTIQIFKDFEDKQFYDTMFFMKSKFTTEKYATKKRNNSAYVLLSQKRFAKIKRIFSNGKKVYVLLQCLEVNDVPLGDVVMTEAFLPLNLVNGEGREIVTKASKIRNAAMFCETAEGSYICEVPFGCWSGF